ncbi:hypothetical protein H4Q32_002288 [Labeo rohita]|uniref:Reverse transcriptase domain-containing protein n=1 Tax=Labeo rohita TaxID=84645 RepID=A0ABQ8MQJ4_LABRO|nr:hypothetical protein H4Q32_002288 [Labeo rohita]
MSESKSLEAKDKSKPRYRQCVPPCSCYILSGDTHSRSPQRSGNGSPYWEKRVAPHSTVSVSLQCPQETNTLTLPVFQGAVVSGNPIPQSLPPGNAAELGSSPPLRGSLEQLVRLVPAGAPFQDTELAVQRNPEASLERLVPLVDYLAAWKLLPNVSAWVLHTVERGYRIQFSAPPPPFSGVFPTLVGPEQGLDGGLRPILDQRQLICSVMRLKFRMLTVSQVVSQIRSEDWFVTIDLKHTYFHVSILHRHRKFLRFAFRGEAYQYRVLPFGLALSARTFTKEPLNDAGTFVTCSDRVNPHCSRENARRLREWMLHPDVVKQIWRVFGQAQVDLFATQENAQCPHWYSLTHLAPLGLDHMVEMWPRLRLYAFSLIALLPGVLERVCRDGFRLLLIAPYWPARAWFSDLISLLDCSPWEIPFRRDLLSQAGGHLRAPSPGVVEVVGVAPEGAHLIAFSLSTEVVVTILQSRAPSRRKLYARRWRLFSRTQLTAQLERFSAGLAHFTLKVYVAAISAYHAPLGGFSVGKDPLVTCFLHGALRLRPLVRPWVPPWDLAVVLEALCWPPFEPVEEPSDHFLTIKTALLLALTSLKSVGDLQALFVVPSHLDFAPGMAKAFLYPRPGYVPVRSGPHARQSGPSPGPQIPYEVDRWKPEMSRSRRRSDDGSKTLRLGPYFLHPCERSLPPEAECRFRRTCFIASWSVTSPARDVSFLYWTFYTCDSEHVYAEGVLIAF